MIVLLATAASTVAFGTCGPGPTTWTVSYADGLVEHYATAENRLDLLPKPGIRFTLIQCQETGCSSPQEFVVDPLAGDVDLDGVVGVPDYLEVLRHWNERAP